MDLVLHCISVTNIVSEAIEGRIEAQKFYFLIQNLSHKIDVLKTDLTRPCRGTKIWPNVNITETRPGTQRKLKIEFLGILQ